MVEIEELKNNIINMVSDSFEINKVQTSFINEFYYPKSIHVLKFNIEQYDIKGLGNMAILKGRGFGIINFLTVVFTPNTKKDIPFVIVDFINMGNKITVFVEFYLKHIYAKENIKTFENRLQKLNTKYEKIKNYIESPNWYTPLRCKYSPLKKGKAKDYNLFSQLIMDNIDEYLKYVKDSEYTLDDKNIKLETFINDLIYKGNPSSAVLEKALGEDGMKRLFKEIIFYTK